MSDLSIAVTSITNRNLWAKTSPDIAAGAAAQVVAARELLVRSSQADLSGGPYTYDLGVWNPADSGRIVRLLELELLSMVGYVTPPSDPIPPATYLKLVKLDAIWGSAAVAPTRDVGLNAPLTKWSDAGIQVQFGTDGGGTATEQVNVPIANAQVPSVGLYYRLYRMSEHIPFLDINPGERLAVETLIDYSSYNALMSVVMGLDAV